jgi:tetratricopeptide repeat protein 30
VALCRYRLKQYSEAIKKLAEIIERGIREHPDLSVGMATEGIDVRSVGNTRVLHETALVEAFNLKAAIEYDLRNRTSGRHSKWAEKGQDGKNDRVKARRLADSPFSYVRGRGC